jgi:hypothetical protein
MQTPKACDSFRGSGAQQVAGLPRADGFAGDFQKAKANYSRQDADERPKQQQVVCHPAKTALVAGEADHLAAGMREFVHVHAFDQRGRPPSAPTK